MSSKWKKARKKTTLEQGTGQGKLRRIFIGRVILKSGISPGLRSDSLTKGLYDRDSEPRVKRNNGVDTPQESPPCRKCGKLHGGECMMGTNTCYSCGKSGHMVKDCANRRSQEQEKERVQPNGPSEKAPRRQRLFAL